MMERIIYVLVFLSTLPTYSQVKLGIGNCATYSNNDKIISSSAEDIPGSSIGAGFIGLLEFPLLKESHSSVLTGLEWSSARHHFVYSGWGLFVTQTTLKIPILYSHYVPIANNVQSFVRLGTAAFYQVGGNINTELASRSVFIERQLEDGLFFLLVVNAGVRYSSKKKHVFDLSIGLQRGFKESERITYSSQHTKSTSVSSNGSYFDIKLIWYPPLR